MAAWRDNFLCGVKSITVNFENASLLPDIFLRKTDAISDSPTCPVEFLKLTY